MKTTIEISDVLMQEMKGFAVRRNTTMRTLIETALRLYLDKQKIYPKSIIARITRLREKGCVREFRKATGIISAI